MACENQIIEIKNNLIQYYHSQQTSQSARFVGLILALFTLLQTFQYSKQLPFNNLFPNIAIIPPCQAWFTQLLKLLLLFLSILFLMIFTIRTIFRFSVYACFPEKAMEISLEDLKGKEGKQLLLHSTFHQLASDKVAEKKVYWMFKLGWFISGRDEFKYGWISSLLLGVAFTMILLALLW